jgi:pyruvate-formate lyase-activating enzyme
MVVKLLKPISIRVGLMYIMKKYLSRTKMKFLYFLMVLALAQIHSKAQLYVPVKIDTSQAKIKSLYLFINDYMKKDTISNEMWHPKYKHKKLPDNNMDWIWGQYTPKKIARTFNMELS